MADGERALPPPLHDVLQAEAVGQQEVEGRVQKGRLVAGHTQRAKQRVDDTHSRTPHAMPGVALAAGQVGREGGQVGGEVERRVDGWKGVGWVEDAVLAQAAYNGVALQRGGALFGGRNG